MPGFIPPIRMVLPGPDYDTGWISFPMNVYTNIPHNLGTKEILVYAVARHKFTYWDEPIDFPYWFYLKQWNRNLHLGWHMLDENTIEIWNHEGTGYQSRVRIWKLG